MKNPIMSDQQKFQPLANLIAEAGPRQQPDPETFDAVYQAVATEWEQVHARRKTSWAPMAAAASMAAIMLLVWQLLPSGSGPNPFQVAALSGTASQWQDGRWQPLEPGGPVPDNILIRTGEHASMALAGPPGVDLRVDADTEFTIAAQTLKLAHGALYLDLSPLAQGSYQIKTPSGVVRHLGTRFAVRYQDQEIQVMVREGRVEVDTGARSIELAAGQVVRANREGVGEITTMAPDAPAWQWVAHASPGLELDGHSVAEFLDWVAVESGLPVVYADTATRRAVHKVTLSGRVNDMSALESLQPVLSATRFTATVVNQQITVSSAL